MKIALYFRNSAFKNVNCSRIEDGNPGIGGTHFAMLQLASLLYKRGCDCYLFAESIVNLPVYIKIIEVEKETQLVNAIIDNNIDILLVNRTTELSFNKHILEILRPTKVKIIVWAHVFMPYKFLNELDKDELVKRVVCVSKHQLDTLYDHPVYSKSCYIYNLCNFKNPLPIISPYISRPNNVVYVGAINYIKGVHLLTNSWEKVRKEIPDAQLFIIGSGYLYNRGSRISKYGISNDYYEKECIRNILVDGKIEPSIHFLGILGSEKWEIMDKCRVGIVNTHYWETFGYTAVEMQLAGLQIASYRSPGLIDTVHKSNGILYNNENQLAESIVKLLRNKEYNPKESTNYIKETFSKEKIENQWICLFEEVYAKVDATQESVSDDFYFSKLQMKNRRLKRIFPFIPSLLYFHEKYLNVKRYCFRLKQPKELLNKIKAMMLNKQNI